MGAAYFIALDNPDPGFDPFVNGKAIARDAEGLSKLAKSKGLPAPEDYFAMSGDDAEAMAGEFGLDEDVTVPPERWFDADEGLAWIASLHPHLESNPAGLKNAKAVLADLAEFESVLSKAKAIGAKWHFSIDF
jgi:hypothetical protein